MLMMRASGFNAAVDEESKAKFVEMRYLDGSIGQIALLAIQPMLHMKHDSCGSSTRRASTLSTRAPRCSEAATGALRRQRQ
jgi:hypothetical protein